MIKIKRVGITIGFMKIYTMKCAMMKLDYFMKLKNFKDIYFLNNIYGQFFYKEN